MLNPTPAQIVFWLDRDLPERSRALAANIDMEQTGAELLEEARSLLRVTLDVARMGLWRWKVDEDSVEFSQSALPLLGLQSDGPLKYKASDLAKIVRSEDAATMGHTFAEAVQNQAMEAEFQVDWPDGSLHTLLSRGRLTSRPGEPRLLTGILIDVSEQRAMSDARDRLASRQVRAGEQAVRMQRVTSKLAEASTAEHVRSVLLHEGSQLANASRGIIYTLNENTRMIERALTVGLEKEHLQLGELPLDAQLPANHCIRETRPVLLTDKKQILEEYPDSAPMIDTFGIESVAAFPLAINGRAMGAWLMLWDEPKNFEEGDLIIFLTLASQAAQAIERIRLFERERFIATALQRTLLPAQLPILDGASTARRYLPTAAGVEVGGDWYDVLPLPNNRVALVIGDVGGHNIDAAAIMGQLRNAIRSYAWEGHPAAKVLEATNRLLCGLEPGVMATCCYVELGLQDGIAAVALAGHPPPLIVNEDGDAAFMNVIADPPLGAEAEHAYEQTSLFLTQGQSIMLYTDGLVESRTMPLDDGMDRLQRACSKEAGIDAEALADAVIDSIAMNEVEDDIALLVLQYAPKHQVVETASSPRQTIRRFLPSSAGSAGVARRLASDVMDDWGEGNAADTVALCVSELVTNALIHTATDIELVLKLDAQYVQVEVIDQSDRMPAMRSGDDDSTTGRGLHIVQAVSADWGVRPEGSGKAVWFRVERSLTSA